MREPKVWMWAEACEVLDRAERLHRQFFRPASAAARQPVWEAPVDMFETARELWIIVALPGVEAGSVRVGVEAGTLVVEAERTLPATLRRGRIHRMEIPHGRFERRAELPPGRFALDGSQLADGCLTLKLRKVY